MSPTRYQRSLFPRNVHGRCFVSGIHGAIPLAPSVYRNGADERDIPIDRTIIYLRAPEPVCPNGRETEQFTYKEKRKSVVPNFSRKQRFVLDTFFYIIRNGRVFYLRNDRSSIRYFAFGEASRINFASSNRYSSLRNDESLTRKINEGSLERNWPPRRRVTCTRRVKTIVFDGI